MVSTARYSTLILERKTIQLGTEGRTTAAVLEDLARKKDLTKTAVIRQAIRLYQMIEVRIASGEKLVFEDEAANKKAELMVL